MIRVVASIAALVFSAALGAPVVAQTQPADAPSAQREALARLSFMQGVWVGQASGYNPNGRPYAVTQTERIGPMLGGDILVIEGRGYNADASTGFNAFAVISWDHAASRYEIRAYDNGNAGTFPFTLTDTGYVWETPAGPGVQRFTAEVTPTTYHEVGVFVMPGQPERKTFEMTLTRRGDTDWPGRDPVVP